MKCWGRIKIWFIMTFKKKEYTLNEKDVYNPYETIIDNYKPQHIKKSFINI